MILPAPGIYPAVLLIQHVLFHRNGKIDAFIHPHPFHTRLIFQKFPHIPGGLLISLAAGQEQRVLQFILRRIQDRAACTGQINGKQRRCHKEYHADRKGNHRALIFLPVPPVILGGQHPRKPQHFPCQSPAFYIPGTDADVLCGTDGIHGRNLPDPPGGYPHGHQHDKKGKSRRQKKRSRIDLHRYLSLIPVHKCRQPASDKMQRDRAPGHPGQKSQRDPRAAYKKRLKSQGFSQLLPGGSHRSKKPELSRPLPQGNQPPEVVTVKITMITASSVPSIPTINWI